MSDGALGDGTDSRIEHVAVEDGVIRIAVTSLTEGESGAFRLQVLRR